MIPLLVQLLFLAVWLRKNKGRSHVVLREWQLEWIVIMEFGALVGIHGDRGAGTV